MRNAVLYSLIVILVYSCSPYARVVKKGTVQEKNAMADEMYKKKDYVRALPLYEELLAVYRGRAESEAIYLKYSFCYYGLGQFDLAAYHFKNFTENYYNSIHMEQANFYYTHCLYRDAHEYFLDQTETIKAITEIQLFLNLYPNTRGVFDTVKTVRNDVLYIDTITFKEQANEDIEELRAKLKRKSFENAMLFFKIQDYHAAVVSFKNTIKDFPDMENKDQIEFLIIKASYEYAKYSVDEKKEERYQAVFDEYREFTKNNTAANKYYREATEINAKAKTELEKHKKLHKIQ